MEERNFIPVKRRTKSCKKRQQQVEPHTLKSTSHSSASTSTQTDPLSMVLFLCLNSFVFLFVCFLGVFLIFFFFCFQIKTVQLDRKKMIPKKPRSVKSKAKQVRTFSFSLIFFLFCSRIQ